MNAAHRVVLACRAAIGVAILASGLQAARAATIDVVVRERGGAAIEGQEIRLAPHPEVGFSWRSFGYPSRQTDGQGTVRFVEVEPGNYTFRLGVPPVVNLLRPEDNPYADAPVVTLPRADSTATITIELWRGVPIVLDVHAIDADLPRGKLLLTHVETGRTYETPFSREDGHEKRFERALVEGRWRSTMEIPPGYLIRELQVNRTTLPGPYAEVDTAIDPQTQHVSWELSAPCEVWGRLLPAGDALPRDSTVVATLIEPGPWLPAETLRGRVHARVEPHWWEPTAVFHIRLPEGLWRITPEAAELESAEPPHVELRLAAGTVAHQDFTLTGPGDDAGSSAQLQVKVVEPKNDAGVGDAFVALYRAGTVGQAEPLRTGRTESQGFRTGSLAFEGLSKGAYEIVAGHRDWLDGRLPVEFDPEANKERSAARVILGQPAVLRVFAFEHDGGKPVSQVEVTADWLAEDYPSPLTDERLDTERRRRAQRSDMTGYATFRGLVDGSYRLGARVTGEHQATRYARLRRAGSAERETLDLDVIVPGEYDVEAVVYLGASITGTIACDDAGPVPPSAAFRAYRAVDAWGENELGPGGFAPSAEDPLGQPVPVLRLDGRALAGRHLDEFVVGPFERGAYVLAFRPESYDGWAWAYGSDLREEAAVLDLAAGRSTDVGAIGALCAPAVLLRPRIESGEEAPDLSAGTYRVEGTRRLDTGDEAPSTPTAEARRGHVLIRHLAPGSTDLRIEIRHPHLIPPRTLHQVSDLKLERGTRLVESVRFAAVGGALNVHTTAAAVRLRIGDRNVATAVPVDGTASLEGLAAGDYLLEACTDAACERPNRDPIPVGVEAQRTREVRLENP